MSPADRYSALRAPEVRETPHLLAAPRQWSELELQARWFAGEFGRDFHTTDGRAAQIVQFGVWNREAGPDFADAAVALDGGEPTRGAIEFDIDARDWERHSHATNPAYENVALHVFTRRGEADFFTRTAAHRQVPQVLLDLSHLAGSTPNPVPEAKLGRCSGPLRELPEEKVRDILRAAAHFRLRRKAAALARASEVHGPDAALFQALAATLGYKSNKLPFTLLAQRLPLGLLRKNREEIEPMLFGVSGFLPAADLSAFEPATRDYLRALWERWWARRDEFSRLTIAPDLWRLGGQRPMNHPQRRLAALAQIVRHWPKVRAFREHVDPGAIGEFFAGLRDPYWDFHFTVTSKPSAKRMALVGESRVTEMLVNVFLPLADDGERGWKACENLRAPLSNRRVEVAATRLLGDSPRRAGLLKSAAIQQGLLQIYEDFCMQDASDCAHCRFPTQLTQW